MSNYVTAEKVSLRLVEKKHFVKDINIRGKFGATSVNYFCLKQVAMNAVKFRIQNLTLKRNSKIA
jgi:hypothetical protein